MTQMLLLVDQRQPESATHAACVVKRFWQLPGKKKTFQRGVIQGLSLPNPWAPEFLWAAGFIS